MPQSFDTLRVGHHYELINHGEVVRFIITEIKDHNQITVKDLDSLEIFNINDLVKFGIGKDYDLKEIE